MTFICIRRSILGISLLLVTVALILGQESCVGSLPSSRPVCGNCEGPNRFVRLEKISPALPEDVQPPFSHPFSLRPHEWSEVLGSISVQKITPGLLIGFIKGAEGPAFTAEEVQYLSTTLPKAFERAQPDEIIVYALIRSPLPNMEEISTGGLFVKNNELHVLLANHRYAVSMSGIRELLWEHPLHSQGVLYELVQGNYQKVKKPDGLGIKSVPLEIIVAYKDLLLGTRPSLGSSKGEPRLSDSGASGLPSSSLSPEIPFEKRLETLKHLRSKDLITEEEFQRKKKELLDQL